MRHDQRVCEDLVGNQDAYKSQYQYGVKDFFQQALIQNIVAHGEHQGRGQHHDIANSQQLFTVVCNAIEKVGG